MSALDQRWPALRGGLLALLAAALFGFSTPLVQRLGVGLGAFSTAACLYAGAALMGALSLRGAKREARLRRSDLPRLLSVAALGAVLGPVALAWGLQRSSGSSASLMLTLEACFTAVVAWRLYGETLDRRVTLALLLLLAGGVVLVLEQGQQSQGTPWGLLAVLLATAAWGLDNGLSRALAERDPGQVVLGKACLGVLASTSLAWALDEALPTWRPALALVLLGVLAYGLSLRFYLLAQRAIGAARTGSVFAFAPFLGAMLAFAMGERTAGWGLALGGGLMLLGLLLHLVEDHAHLHEHAAQTHEHAHRHDDGHHHHHHDPMPVGAHSHVHHHEALHHHHAHVPDDMHRHEH